MNDALLSSVAEDFRFFAQSQCPGRSETYRRLSLCIAEAPDLLTLLATATPGQRRPSLLFAAVQFLLMRHHQDEPLAAWYPAVTGRPMAQHDPWDTFAEFCRRHHAELLTAIKTGRTQTNEVRRTAALVLALEHVRPALGGRFAILELGASAGLNLLFDQFRYRLPGGAVGPAASPVVIRPLVSGEAPHPSHLPEIVWRRGVDLAPVDVYDDAARDWLRAFIWPEQQAERDRLTAALSLARKKPPVVVRADAVNELCRVVDDAPADTPLCLFHTSLLTYLNQPQSETLFEHIRSIVARRPAIWIYLEAAGLLRRRGGPAAVTAHHCTDRDRYALGVVTDRIDTVLGRVDTYGESIQWL